MAVDSSRDKQNTVSQLQSYCNTILDTINKALQLRQEAIDKGYQPGGADAITDALLNGGVSPAPNTTYPFPQLIASDLTAALAAIASLDTQLAASSRTGYKAMGKLR